MYPFTVRHDAGPGEYAVYPAKWVETKPSETIEGNLYPSRVDYAGVDGVCSIYNGDVYVMNENGKTVSTFHLEGQPVSVQGRPQPDEHYGKTS